ncbi:hypothetical protein BDY24DRAFT_182123 [Mrakia frigida]|uniref:uncharacterized protein n=1 Tax=Mrakia frigida TaxID=29902 RepID=UPI003FCC0DD7
MSLTSSAVSSSEDPTLPPFHAVRPFVPPEEFLPFIRTSVQTKHPFRLDYLFPDPPQWLDNLIPIVGVSIATGTLIGLYKGGATRAARFTAENAHRKPRRLKAWFYYKRVSTRVHLVWAYV